MKSISRAAITASALGLVLAVLVVPSASASKTLTVERIYADPPLTGSPPTSIRWLPDSKRVSFVEKRGEGEEKQTYLVLAELNGRRRTLCIADTVSVPDDLSSSDGDKFKFGTYRWAARGDLGVLRFKGDLFTINHKNGDIVRRTRTDVSEANIAFSPDGKMIAFTRKHDLWAIDIEEGTEIQLTDTGDDSLLNGVLDWVYMEELFTRGNVKGYWWSPDSRKIAYLQINEQPVETFPIVDFLPTYNRADMQHYPKAGSKNPIVRVGIYHFDTGETVWTDVDTEDDSYIARVHWLGGSDKVAIEKLNRNQDHLELRFADAATGVSEPILEERKDTWVNVTYMKHFYEDADRFVWNSERDGHSHLYLYKTDGSLVRPLTQGEWDVTSLDAVDEKRGHIYFTALEKSILERQLYRVGENGRDLRRVTRGEGTHSVEFSPDNRYYIDSYANATTPKQIAVYDATGRKKFAIFEDEFEELASYELPATEFFRITSEEGIEFQCSMIKPKDFDESKKYPVLVYTYGGPHAQVVRNNWGGTRHLWHAMMAQRGYIIFSLDNRGSFGRGPEWENPVLKNMGHYELQDQLAGVEYLKQQPWVDAGRIGIWGWSYGGYMTCMAMFKAPGVFKAGASVAPVSDWRFYDTIYTERYMKHPDDNEEGYEESAPVNFVDGLEGEFLLVHGTSDDNVHMANSMRLIDELIEAGKPFDLMLYPRMLHGISSDAARVHLYRKLTRFFDTNLRGEGRAAEASSLP
jgi:dipeptidyl-peptidase-4